MHISLKFVVKVGVVGSRIVGRPQEVPLAPGLEVRGQVELGAVEVLKP